MGSILSRDSLWAQHLSCKQPVAQWTGCGLLMCGAGTQGNGPGFYIIHFQGLILRTWPSNASTCFLDPREIILWLLLKPEGLFLYTRSSVTLGLLTYSSIRQLLLSKLKIFGLLFLANYISQKFVLICPGEPARDPP